jgi:FPC/CPF motif-containing protein YcgG
MSENINNIFRTVQAETQCPFAKSATITFARSIAAEFSVPEAAQQLYEDIAAYVQEGIATAPDGLAVALPNTVIGDDFKSLTSGFNSLYHSLKINDGSSEEAIATENIENPGWQLTIAGQRLFTIVFSSLYPAANPRHIHEANTTFVFFQPVQSFNTRIPFDKDSAEFKKLKANIRSRFTEAGLAYDGAINDDPREAAKYLSPQHLGMQAVKWWKSDRPEV